MAKVILFNKPFGVLSQFTDKGTQDSPRATLSKYIKEPNIYPAGRLDRDSEGLLLLTDNGQLQAKITNPRFEKPKTYLVQVEGLPDDTALAALRKGVHLKDGLTAPAQAEAIAPPMLWERDPPIRFRKTVSDSWVRLTITEGRNRQVRRMLAHVGFPCLRLVRWSIGDWSLEGLKLGATQELHVETPADSIRKAPTARRPPKKTDDKKPFKRTSSPRRST